MKRFAFILLTILLGATQAKAYDFELNGIYYSFIEGATDEVEVTYFIDYWDDDFDGVGNYEGDIVIPEAIIYEGKEYWVTGIGEIAFKEASIESVIIPKSVKRIGLGAFRNLRGTLKQLEVQWQTPYELSLLKIDSSFDTDFEQIVLVVPQNTQTLYLEHEVWGRFTHIIEEGTEMLPAQAADDALEPVKITILDGTVTLEMDKCIEFDCIGIQFGDKTLNWGTGTYLEIKKMGEYYVIEGKKYVTINEAIKAYLKELILDFYDRNTSDRLGKDVWAAFVEEGGLQLFLDTAAEYIDDEFLTSPLNTIYG